MLSWKQEETVCLSLDPLDAAFLLQMTQQHVKQMWGEHGHRLAALHFPVYSMNTIHQRPSLTMLPHPLVMTLYLCGCHHSHSPVSLFTDKHWSHSPHPQCLSLNLFALSGTRYWNSVNHTFQGSPTLMICSSPSSLHWFPHHPVFLPGRTAGFFLSLCHVLHAFASFISSHPCQRSVRFCGVARGGMISRLHLLPPPGGSAVVQEGGESQESAEEGICANALPAIAFSSNACKDLATVN